ncbi:MULTISPECIES: hypothetical protein [Thermomonas]|jgi:hypothetical protein|uniref:hypothetical protein n=1 Tax=Thermomonas TaxID=141948 RepID=UPI0003FD25ED|nr:MULTISPECIES: hypothetical protein [Thermomonas]
MTQRVAVIEWVDNGTGKVPVFFDRKYRLFDPFHDYVASVAVRKRLAAPQGAYASAVEAAAYALLAWLRYLEESKVTWERASDGTLQQFRDAALKQVLGSLRSKGNERTAKRTVNVRLQWIYRYYRWAQQDAGLCKGVIGPGLAINSAITQPKRKRQRSRKKREVDLDLYPLCFTGVSGTAGGTQYFATAKDKQRIAEFFAKGADPFIVERNQIILELSDRIGWRAGTITYLTIDAFNEEAIEKAEEDGLVVTPSVQKLAYQNSFTIPLTLALRIVRHIEARQRWLAKHKWTEKQAQCRLFLSGKTGRPLGGKTIVQLIGGAFRAIGVVAKIGAGHHSLRRKFADESTRDDLAARRSMGLSTAVEDVMHATAKRLGQRNIASQTPYQRAVRDGTRQAESHRLRAELQETEALLATKDAKIAALERQLQEQAKANKATRAAKARVRRATR